MFLPVSRKPRGSWLKDLICWGSYQLTHLASGRNFFPERQIATGGWGLLPRIFSAYSFSLQWWDTGSVLISHALPHVIGCYWYWPGIVSWRYVRVWSGNFRDSLGMWSVCECRDWTPWARSGCWGQHPVAVASLLNYIYVLFRLQVDCLGSGP